MKLCGANSMSRPCKIQMTPTNAKNDPERLAQVPHRSNIALDSDGCAS